MTNQPPRETLQGVVKTVTFSNPENGYFVAKVQVGKLERTVVGNSPAINPGERLKASGKWESSNWGPQFKASEVLLFPPDMADGIERYLASAVEGVGKSFAKKLVEALGDKVFEVIENTPEKLRDIPGIGKKRAQSLVDAYKEQRAVRDIMVFLFKNGLPSSKAHAVHKRYGERAVETIRENPYVLCKDIHGIGFLTADKFARKMGIEERSDFRLEAGVMHLLTEASGAGSCGMPHGEVLSRGTELLGVDVEDVKRGIELALHAGRLTRDAAGTTECLFVTKLYETERDIAKMLLAKRDEPVARPILDVDHCILDAELSLGITLDEGQREAVKKALMSPLCIITGGPGTGKTTVTKVILHVLTENGITSTMLMAPTGKAAKRLSEASGVQSLTIHRALEVDAGGRFKRGPDNPLVAQMVQCDEFSMADVFLTYSLLRAIAHGTRVLLVGDQDQLPSVGPGRVLADMIESRVLPVARLTRVFRQGDGSTIKVNAHKVNSGEHITPADNGADFRFLDYSPKNPKDPAQSEDARKALEEDLLRTVQNLYKLGYDPLRDVQVLVPMRKGSLGTEALNTKLQNLLNPHPAQQLERNGMFWRTGDRVMQVRNNYTKEIFNGDVGFITSIDDTAKLLHVEFDGRTVEYKFTELDELVLAYAFTIHKSQGSEFPVVVTPMTSAHYVMLRRNLLYTAMTRARKLFLLFGMQYSVNMAVDQNQTEERYSKLEDWLKKLSR